jgi:SAM-dependent methyltransferase
MHFFLNVGGVTALMPFTGVPLLFISSGGSSLMSVCMALGICQSCIRYIRARRCIYENRQWKIWFSKIGKRSGQGTRPTADKIKGAIFSSLGNHFDGGRFLDCYSGTGNMALEALSRGMDEVVCVDTSTKAIQTIKKNVACYRLGRNVRSFVEISLRYWID